LDFGDSPWEALIHRLAETLDCDEDELLHMAGRTPEGILRRILDQLKLFRALAKCNDATVHDVADSVIVASIALCDSFLRTKYQDFVYLGSILAEEDADYLTFSFKVT